MAIEDLEASLGLTFNDRGLLRQALVHRSYLNEHGGSSLDSYERMEFLGDAVLELIISTELYRNLPRVTEGELTKGRSSLVCRPSLAGASRRLSLGSYLHLGKGELESGGQDRESILEEAFEALVAAIYLDQGYDAARHFVLTALEPDLAEFNTRGRLHENPKSRLQERVQALGRSTPRYRLVSAEGPDHQPIFTVEVVVDDQVLAQGTGSKKSDAERTAAQSVLDNWDATEAMWAQEENSPSAVGPLSDNVAGPNDNKQRHSGKVPKDNLCSLSFKETGKATSKKPERVSNAAANAGSAASSTFFAPLTWMKRLGKNSKKS